MLDWLRWIKCKLGFHRLAFNNVTPGQPQYPGNYCLNCHRYLFQGKPTTSRSIKGLVNAIYDNVAKPIIVDYPDRLPIASKPKMQYQATRMLDL